GPAGTADVATTVSESLTRTVTGNAITGTYAESDVATVVETSDESDDGPAGTASVHTTVSDASTKAITGSALFDSYAESDSDTSTQASSLTQTQSGSGGTDTLTLDTTETITNSGNGNRLSGTSSTAYSDTLVKTSSDVFATAAESGATTQVETLSSDSSETA